jgi:hypothetical protein
MKKLVNGKPQYHVQKDLQIIHGMTMKVNGKK